jgi:hypothetical protein
LLGLGVAVIPERYACRGLGAGRNGSLSDTTVREGTMAGDEVEVTARPRRRLEEEYGMREAAYLTDRPSGGWDALATREQLEAFEQRVDLRFEALEERLMREIDRRFRLQTTFLVSAMLAGLGLFGLLVR